ncbi:MAG: hypothetical protein IJ731_06835 [Eubacterium sp.]|nr:hypothetical protein [Eubacterium sp.]
MLTTTAQVLKYDGSRLLLQPTDSIGRELRQKQITTVEVRLPDGRTISPKQRRKIWALIRDIDEWAGNYVPEYTRNVLEYNFITTMEYEEWFSLSTVDMTTERLFIDYLVAFCFENDVPTKDTLLHQTDDIGKYLYLCLEHRKCAICNDYAEVHHVDKIGMGRDREKIVHIGLKAIALCHKHHIEAHNDEKGLFNNYHIYGIRLDKYLCECLNLNTKERNS